MILLSPRNTTKGRLRIMIHMNAPVEEPRSKSETTYVGATILGIAFGALGVALSAIGFMGTKLSAICPGNEIGSGFSIGSAICIVPDVVFCLSLLAHRRGRLTLRTVLSVLATVTAFFIAADAVLMAANVGLSCSGAQYVPFLMIAGFIFLCDCVVGLAAVGASLMRGRVA